MELSTDSLSAQFRRTTRLGSALLARITSRVPDAPSRRPLSAQIARLRWQIPLLASLLVLGQQLLEQYALPPGAHFRLLPELLLYGLFGPIIVWLALGWIQRRVMIKEAAEDELVQAHAELTQLHQHVSFLLKINQRLGEAADEDELAALALQLVQEAAPLAASALIRFDEHRQPMPVEYRGALQESLLAAWHQHLASNAVRERCAVCQPRSAQMGEACPLFERLPLEDVGAVVCFSLARGEIEFGILGLYLPDGQTLTQDEKSMLEAVAAEISSAFENIRLRSRELTTFYEVNEAIHQRLDLDGLMGRILSHTMEASDADAGLLLLQGQDEELDLRVTSGRWEGADRLPLIESLAAGALETGEAVVVGDLKAADDAAASVLCAPMTTDETALGVISLGSSRPIGFTPRQTRLVSAIAGQAALLVENARLYARLEHQAILAERGRLAREMHDGLSQTLGYLKMRSQQIRRWLEHDQVEQARTGLRELAQTANDVYLELRTAIDGLRVPLRDGAGSVARLRACVAEFETRTDIPVEFAVTIDHGLPPAAEAHLLRLVQEALTNIRKHAQAHHVSVNLEAGADPNCLRLQIRDDGRGFNASALDASDRHGLNIMRERASLIGADLQVHSQPGEGTQVMLKWTSAPVLAEDR